MKRAIFILITLSLASLSLFGQPVQIEHANLIGGSNDDIGIHIIETSDGGYLTLGTTLSYDGDISLTFNSSTNRSSKDLWLVKLDSVFNIEWEKCYGSAVFDEAGKLAQTLDGNYLIAATVKAGNGNVSNFYGGDSDIWIVKVDPSGNILWEKNYGGSDEDVVEDLAVTADGGFAFIGNTYSNDHDVSSLLGTGSMWLVRLDANGNILWERTYGGSSIDHGKALETTPTGGFIIGADCLSTDGDLTNIPRFGASVDVWLFEVNALGDIVWSNVYGGTGSDQIIEFNRLSDGGYMLNCYISSNDGHVSTSFGGTDVWLVRVDSVGNIMWENTFGGLRSDYSRTEVLELSDGTFLFTMYSSSYDGLYSGSYSPPNFDAWLIRVNGNDGSLLRLQNFGGNFSDNVNAMLLNSSDKVVFCGSSNSTTNDLANIVRPTTGDQYQWIFSTSMVELGIIKDTIEGKVFWDEDLSCSIDTSIDRPLHNWVVRSTGQQQAYASTNANGEYKFFATDTGPLEWSVVIPNIFSPLIDTICNITHNTVVDTIGARKTGFDFPIGIVECPLLTSSLFIDRVRPCVSSLMTISYCNAGFGDAHNVQITLDVPEHIIIDSSSMSFTYNSIGRPIFQIDTINPGVCDSIVLNVSTACDLFIARTQSCSQVWITSSDTCNNPQVAVWDSSNLKITSACLDDRTSQFIIINRGADMSSWEEYRLYDASGFVTSDTFKLDAGDSIFIDVHYATGTFLRLEVDNTPGNPYASTRFLELGVCSSGQFNVGYVPSSYPMHDDPIATDIECVVISNSLDPNDKQVVPAGVTDQHYVALGSLLNYTVRFQNTGNDTAYRVEVIDTLSPHLDISSLQLGAVSHNYTYYVNGSTTPIIHFVFEDINLLDSLSNEPESHGFIQFKIAPKSNTPENTVIENFVDIYFDFNDPVRTNTPFVTLKDVLPNSNKEYVVTVNGDTVFVSAQELLAELAPQIRLYPNPTNGKQINIDLGSTKIDRSKIELYSLTGQLVGSYELSSSNNNIELDLERGFYLYRILNAESALKSGKLLLIE